MNPRLKSLSERPLRSILISRRKRGFIPVMPPIIDIFDTPPVLVSDKKHATPKHTY